MATGSMPGTGTNDSSRNRISAPSVNHSRFLSSVALLKLASVMLDASCSAADAIVFDNPLGSAAHIRRDTVIARDPGPDPGDEAIHGCLDCFVPLAMTFRPRPWRRPDRPAASREPC